MRLLVGIGVAVFWGRHFRLSGPRSRYGGHHPPYLSIPSISRGIGGSWPSGSQGREAPHWCPAWQATASNRPRCDGSRRSPGRPPAHGPSPRRSGRRSGSRPHAPWPASSGASGGSPASRVPRCGTARPSPADIAASAGSAPNRSTATTTISSIIQRSKKPGSRHGKASRSYDTVKDEGARMNSLGSAGRLTVGGHLRAKKPAARALSSRAALSETEAPMPPLPCLILLTGLCAGPSGSALDVSDLMGTWDDVTPQRGAQATRCRSQGRRDLRGHGLHLGERGQPQGPPVALRARGGRGASRACVS